MICQTITAMITLAIATVALFALGVLTHLVPSMRRGRVGYPANLASGGSTDLEDLPRPREAFELVLSRQREREFVTGDKVCNGI